MANRWINMNCYVCEKKLDIAVDKCCYRKTEVIDDLEYRCLWHGPPGIRNTMAFGSYADTLQEARRRAEMYLIGSSAPYAAPEVKEQEQIILDEVNRIEALEV